MKRIACKGEDILNDVYSFTGRFIAYPSEHAHVAHVLWIVHTFLMDCWDCTPRLAVLSPTRECGKTRVLEVTESLVPRPIMAVNVSSAYLFRSVASDDGRPTILFDEIDTVFGQNARYNEDIRAMINAGNRKGVGAGRVVKRGDSFVTEKLPAYCAIAMAGIGLSTLPDTVVSRSIILSMRRRSKSERVEPWRVRDCGAEGNSIRDSLATWADTIQSSLIGSYPKMPSGVEDRAADVWEPLLCVADAAGGAWPERARVACVALVADSTGKEESLSVKLLKDLRTVFASQSAMFTEDLLKALKEIDNAPWNEHELNAYKLASHLRVFGVKPKDIRIESKRLKGYTRDELVDAWGRYLPLLTK
jgi:hypothetical protein